MSFEQHLVVHESGKHNGDRLNYCNMPINFNLAAFFCFVESRNARTLFWSAFTLKKGMPAISP